MTRMIERWFPSAEVSNNSDRGWGSGNSEISLFMWFAKRPTAQAKAATICSLLLWPEDRAEQERLQDLVRSAMTGRYAAWSQLRAEIEKANPGGASTLDPFSAVAGSTAFTMTVTGSGFISGTTVLWNGAALPTTFVDAQTLSVTVGAGQVAASGLLPVTARAPAPGSFTSNSASFVVAARTPAITSLAPAGAQAGGPAFTLTVTGSNFAADAQVLWNGAPLATQVVSASQLTAQISAALIANGQTAGVAVRNQQPDARISSATAFVVTPGNGPRLYLPAIRR